MLELDKEQRYDALKLRFQDQVELLRFLMRIDLQIVFGYITLQLLLAGWVANHPVDRFWPKLGIFIVDLAMLFATLRILWSSRLRREEVVQTVKNCCRALGYEESGVYGIPVGLNAHTARKRWWLPFLTAIAASTVGVGLVLFLG